MKYLLIFILFLMLSFNSSFAQDDWFASTEEEAIEVQEYHHHHLGLFLGAMSQLSNGHISFASGLDYSYFFPDVFPIVGIGAYAEGAFGEHTEFILGGTFTLQPWDEVKFYVAPSALFQSLDSTEIDAVHKTSETRFLLRFGSSYSFHFENYSIAPTISADIIGSKVNLVYGISFGYGF